MARGVRAAWLLALAFGALGLPPRGDGEDAPAVVLEPYAGFLPDAAPDRVAVLLVRDERTGRPIAGARVRRHGEWDLDEDGQWAPPDGEWRADEHGLVVVDLRATPDEVWVAHWAVDAPGYCPEEAYGEWPQEVVDLLPGVDLHGVMVDAFGRPAAGVEVEWKRGCAHAPALRTARTDAAGRFVLRSVSFDGDLCWEGPGVLADYGDPLDLAPTDAPAPLVRASLGVAVEGRIVGADLSSRWGLALFGRASSRGPRAAVAPDGRFRIEGVSPTGTVLHFWGADKDLGEGEILDDTASFRPGRPLVWNLRHPLGDPTDPARPTVEVPVRLRFPAGTRGPVAEGEDGAEGDPVRVEVVADAVETGRRTDAYLDIGSSEASMALPVGAYDLTVGPSPFARWHAPARRVVVAEGVAPVEIEVAERPRLRVEGLPAVGGESDGDDGRIVLRLVTPGAEWGGSVGPTEDPVHLPAEVEAVAWVGSVERPFPVGPVADGVRTVVVDLRPTATLQVRGIDGLDGDRVTLAGRRAVAREVEGGLDIAWFGPPGRYDLEVEGTEKGEAGGPWRASVEVSVGPDSVVALRRADLRLAPRGTVRIEASAGLALDEARVTAWPRLNRYPQDLEEGPDRTFSGPWLEEGTWVRLEGGADQSDDFLPLHPLRARLEGRGPWRLSPGTATLVVRIPMHAGGMDGLLESTEGGGYRLRTTAGRYHPGVLLDGDWVESVRYDGPVGLSGPFPIPYARPRDLLCTAKGLRAGEHTLLVGAHGRRSMQGRVRLREGETREVVVPLAPL